jgi:tRNA acetyltransferase TAN1
MQYVETLFGTENEETMKPDDIEQDNHDADIEASIREEISDLKKSSSKNLFQPVKIDVRCVVFFKTRAPIEPVALVHRVCTDTLQGHREQRSRWTRRLTPMSMMGKATEKGLEDVSKVVLAPHFHADGVKSKKV